MASAEELATTPLAASQDPAPRTSQEGDSNDDGSDDSSDWDPETDFWAEPMAYAHDETHTKHEVNTLREFLSDNGNDAALWAPRFWTTREDELPLNGFKLRMSYLIRAAILGLRQKHLRIIDLLLAIHRMDPTSMGWTHAQKQRFPDWHEWTDIECTIMWRVRDHYRADWAWRYGSADDSLEVALQRLRTSSAFFALWSGRYTGWSDLTRGLFFLRGALECDPPGQDHDDRSTPEKVAGILDAHLGAGTQYLIQASQWIYGCQLRPELGEMLFPLAADEEPDERCVWRGTPGWSTARWEFWKQRLEVLQDHPHLQDITRALVRGSITSMRIAEQEVEAKGKGVYDERPNWDQD